MKLRDTLRQMLAVLQAERQALAGLDVDVIMGSAVEKHGLCSTLEEASPVVLDDECRGLLEAAQQLNETNRRIRNLVAANVSARLDALAGRPAIYRVRQNGVGR